MIAKVRKSIFILLGVLLGSVARAKPEAQMVLIPSGKYLPFLASEVVKNNEAERPKASSRRPTQVDSFWLDQFPVTVAEYVLFLKRNPGWRKSQAKALFIDSHYLESWKEDLKPTAHPNSPITQVSWFAANAYCAWQGKILPTIDQWEYAAYDLGRNNEAVKERILGWYSMPNQKKMGTVGKSPKNGFGIYDLYGLIWEWTFDFNSLIVGSEARSANSKDSGLFCGSGSLNTLDPSDYAAFMRFSLRNSLKANYTTANLGFRCAKEVGQ